MYAICMLHHHHHNKLWVNTSWTSSLSRVERGVPCSWYLCFHLLILKSTLFSSLQIELATGNFPYKQWKTPFEQLKQVVHEPSPKLPDGGPYSDEFRDFVVQW